MGLSEITEIYKNSPLQKINDYIILKAIKEILLINTDLIDIRLIALNFGLISLRDRKRNNLKKKSCLEFSLHSSKSLLLVCPLTRCSPPPPSGLVQKPPGQIP